MAVTHPTAVRNSVADLVVGGGVLNSGTLVLQTSGGTAVATLGLNATAFAAASSGQAVANAISDDTNAAGGTIAKGVLKTSGAADRVLFSVGTSGADINMTSVAINAGDRVACSALTYVAMP